ncbi:MAG: flagellar hook-associated protein FlgK [Alicyclobacillus sp.]|nr:flagellar hook-associated protein FlgK [Alicyclobacillus sp.]
MFGTFLGLETAKRGLQAAQASVETAAHNIDNANTPGYSRQRVDLTETPALPDPSLASAWAGQVGTGVQVEQVQRLRDSYLDSQYRQQNQALGQWTAEQDALQKISAILNEPSDTGLSTVMQNFWNAWDKLSANPGDLSARTLVVQNGVTVAQTLNQTANQLADLAADLQTSLQTNVNQVNSYLTQIAQLNQEIDSVQAVGDQPNDLLDQRDELLDQLSNLADLDVSGTGASFQVSIGGTVVLKDGTVQTDSNGQPLLQDNGGTLTLAVNGGQLKGLTDALATLQGYQADLDAFAAGLANGPVTITLSGAWTFDAGPSGTNLPVSVTFNNQTYTSADPAHNAQQLLAATGGSSSTASNGDVLVTIPQGTTLTVGGLNALLQMGYDSNGQQGVPFFEAGGGAGSGSGGGTWTAANITVNSTLTQDVTKLATGFTPDAGDGTLAITASNVKSSQVQFAAPAGSSVQMPLTKGTLDAFLQAVVGQLGVQGQQANQQVTNLQALVQQVDTQRQSVSGVSIDEEMSDIIRFQQAYNASAKVISTLNEMLDELLQNV